MGGAWGAKPTDEAMMQGTEDAHGGEGAVGGADVGEGAVGGADVGEGAVGGADVGMRTVMEVRVSCTCHSTCARCKGFLLLSLPLRLD